MFNLRPKDDIFYDLFSENAEAIYEAAQTFIKFVQDEEYTGERLKVLTDMEKKSDRIVHKTLEQLYKNFLTPFDREDIFALVKQMDDIPDYIESSASRFVIYNMEKPTDDAKKLCDLIEASTKEVIIMMSEFRHMSRNKKLMEEIIKINKIEEDGDYISRHAIKALFSDNSKFSVLEVVKWRGIYRQLENTLDACEDVANLIEGIVMKNA